MDNKAKYLPSEGMMAPLHHPQTIHGSFQQTPLPPPPHDQPHGLPTAIPRTSAYEHRQQPYHPPGPPLTSHFHAPYPPPPQRLFPPSQSAPATSHAVSRTHSPRTYRPVNSAQPDPTPHSAPLPRDYTTPRIPYTGIGEPPAPEVSNSEHTSLPLGYTQHVLPHHDQPPPGARHDGGIVPYPLQRKAARALQACDQCRARKAKCDEGRPACSHCRENYIDCRYKDLPPQKQEKSIKLVLDRFQKFEENITRKYAKIDKLIHHAFQSLPGDASSETSPEDPPQKATKDRYTTANVPLKSQPPTPAALELSRVGLKKIPESNLRSYINTVQDMHSQPPPKVQNQGPEEELSVPQNHTTAAHKLLDWKSIQQLLNDETRPDYVLRNERKRSWIRIYEGDEGVRHDIEYYLRYGLAIPHQARVEGHPLDASDYLNTNPDVVRRLFRSYMSNMHVLHPFMDAKTLEQKVGVFIQRYTPPRKNMVNCANKGHGMKRKRTAEHMHIAAPEMSPSPSLNSENWSSHGIEHSIDNAIILMVLALGAICEHKTALPGFAPDPNERLRVKQESASLPDYPKSLDVIPGLAYYACAAGILGEMQGGCEMPFVQASILASFYASQLAHPFQSHSWICQAAIKLINYIKIPKETISPPKELCEFAYWSCVQHESDLLAELDLTPSVISQSKIKIELPTGYLRTIKASVMFYYLAQIRLCKLQNQIHQSLYNTKIKHLPDQIMSAFSVSLDNWKQDLPDLMQWQEGDEPSDDIYTAHLRAKYYRARYLIYRPILERALHPELSRAEGKGKTENDFSESLHYDELDDETRRACEQCITAAIRSTKAFHNIKGRPIVTDIFGTGHAQFGNILVLSATYKSNLSQLVNADELERLFQRTIKFLTMYKDISPTLMTDAQILSDIYEKIFKKPLLS